MLPLSSFLVLQPVQLFEVVSDVTHAALTWEAGSVQVLAARVNKWNKDPLHPESLQHVDRWVFSSSKIFCEYQAVLLDQPLHLQSASHLRPNFMFQSACQGMCGWESKFWHIQRRLESLQLRSFKARRQPLYSLTWRGNRSRVASDKYQTSNGFTNT